MHSEHSVILFFFFNAPATTEIYTLSLHDALPIFMPVVASLTVALGADPLLLALPAAMAASWGFMLPSGTGPNAIAWATDRKSTRLNSSQGYISYAVFCLKKKKEK